MVLLFPFYCSVLHRIAFYHIISTTQSLFWSYFLSPLQSSFLSFHCHPPIILSVPSNISPLPLSPLPLSVTPAAAPRPDHPAIPPVSPPASHQDSPHPSPHIKPSPPLSRTVREGRQGGEFFRWYPRSTVTLSFLYPLLPFFTISYLALSLFLTERTNPPSPLVAVIPVI